MTRRQVSVSVGALLVAVLVVTGLVFKSDVLYVNVPVEELSAFDLLGNSESGAVVASQEVVVERLGEELVGGDVAALPSDTPIVVAEVAMSGDSSKWCRRLSVEVLQRSRGVLHLLVERPRWAEFIAGAGCEEDAPSPGGVLIPIDRDAIQTRTRVILSHGGGPFFEASCRASEYLEPCSGPDD